MGMPLPRGAFLEKQHGGARNYAVRQTRKNVVVRIHSVSPTAGEIFYLRAVLQHHRGRSFNDLRTVAGTTYGTWHEAALRLGLFHSENEGHYALEEAITALRTPAQLRFLFARIILEGYAAIPLWDDFKHFLTRDHVDRLHSESLGCDQALRDLAHFIREGGRHLSEYGLPEPDNLSRDTLAEMEAFEPRCEELREIAHDAHQMLTDEQRQVFDKIYAYISCAPSNPNSRPLFIEGRPGRGKSFVVQAILASLRSNGHIVLIVGTTALAVQQYERGRTAHHMFRLPVNEVNNYSFHVTHELTYITIRTTPRSNLSSPPEQVEQA